MSNESADVGLIGLAVMGENLALNMESRGFRVAVFNRTTARVDEFIEGRAKGKRFIALAGQERIVYDQNLAFVAEESARHKRKGGESDE